MSFTVTHETSELLVEVLSCDMYNVDGGWGDVMARFVRKDIEHQPHCNTNTNA